MTTIGRPIGSTLLTDDEVRTYIRAMDKEGRWPTYYWAHEQGCLCDIHRFARLRDALAVAGELTSKPSQVKRSHKAIAKRNDQQRERRKDRTEERRKRANDFLAIPGAHTKWENRRPRASDLAKREACRTGSLHPQNGLAQPRAKRAVKPPWMPTWATGWHTSLSVSLALEIESIRSYRAAWRHLTT